MTQELTPHATIIGAGIIGMSTAAFLQRAGYRVTVIDRVPPGEGCSFGNAGGIAEANEHAIKKAHGYEAKRLSGDECREIEPALSKHIPCGAFHGGWYFVKNPERVVKSIAGAVTRNGGEIVTDEVATIVQDSGRASILMLKSGAQRKLDQLVICAGAWSHLLSRQFGDKVLLEAERGYHMVLPKPGITLERSLTYASTPGAATPMEVGLRLAGTDEFGGLTAAPNWQRADNLWRIFKKLLPDLKEPGPDATRWMGHRPGTPDSLPVISKASRMGNVWYGFGHGHMGLTWGPSSGRLLSELMSGIKSNIDTAPFRVERF